MYIECKGGGTFGPPSRRDARGAYAFGAALTGPGRIGRVSFSQTGRTVYYRGRQLRTQPGLYKASHIDAESGEVYWISGPKRNGEDCLYPGIVEIDADVREAYWTQIRGKPESVRLTRYRSDGKYAHRRLK